MEETPEVCYTLPKMPPLYYVLFLYAYHDGECI